VYRFKEYIYTLYNIIITWYNNNNNKDNKDNNNNNNNNNNDNDNKRAYVGQIE
jgi:hypothetical protein